MRGPAQSLLHLDHDRGPSNRSGTPIMFTGRTTARVEQETDEWEAKTARHPHYQQIMPGSLEVAKNLNAFWAPVKKVEPTRLTKDKLPTDEPEGLSLLWNELRAANVSIYKLCEFDPSSMNGMRDLFCTFIGHRGSGKTTTMYDLAERWGKFFSHGVCFSATNRLNKGWSGVFPRKFIVKEVAPLHSCLAAQEKMMEDNEANAVALADPDNDPRPGFFLFEDEGAENKLRNDDVDEIAAIGRHLNMECFFALQHWNQAKPRTRDATDLWFIYYQLSERSIENLFEIMGGYFGDKRTFRMFLNANTLRDPEFEGDTGGGHCLVVYARRPQQTIYQNCFHFRARPRDKVAPFRIGSQTFWEEARALERNDKANARSFGVPLSQEQLNDMLRFAVDNRGMVY